MPRKAGEKCRRPDCPNRPVTEHQLCVVHKRPGSGYPIEHRLASKTNRTEICWLWTGSKFRDGYGQIFWNGKNWKTHRVAYRLYVGEIPDGMLVCHHCDTPHCVRPDHLFIGSPQDNSDDMVRKGRYVDRMGSKHHLTHLTDSDVRAIRGQWLAGIPQAVVGKRFTISQTCVSTICRGKNWAHVAGVALPVVVDSANKVQP